MFSFESFMNFHQTRQNDGFFWKEWEILWKKSKRPPQSNSNATLWIVNNWLKLDLCTNDHNTTKHLECIQVMTKVTDCTTTQWSWIPSGVKGTKISILMVQSPVLWYISWFFKKFYFSSPIFLLLQSSRDVLFENIWYIVFFILDQTFSFVCSDRSTGNWKAHWKMWKWEHIKWWFSWFDKNVKLYLGN